MDISILENWELASYVVTVFALPFAVLVYAIDKRHERQNEEEEIYQKLSDEYSVLQQLILQNADLYLISKGESNETQLTSEQIERRLIIFDLLISLFERAYILVYEEKMSSQQKRLWASWHDYMVTWCKRSDFRTALPQLLKGEDPDFCNYFLNLSKSVTMSDTL
ncbi:MAG: hypothetical protein ACXWQQ_13775 [Pseudobdellovibrio sp.]